LVRDLRRAEPRRLKRRPIMENMGRAFRQLLATEPYLFTAGVYDPLGAQLAERVGMKSVYLSGYSMAMANGWPDMGFLTQTEVTRIASMVARGTRLPIIAHTDAYGAVGGSLEEAIRRGRAYADAGVDLVWAELSNAAREPAIAFAKAMRETHPRLPLAFNYSSSFRWHQDPNPLTFKELG